RDIEGVGPRKPELCRDFHGGGGFEVLACNTATNHQVDLVERRAVLAQAMPSCSDCMVRDTNREIRFQEALPRVAQAEDLFDGRLERGPIPLGAFVAFTHAANRFLVVDQGFGEADAGFGKVELGGTHKLITWPDGNSSGGRAARTYVHS